MGINRQGIYLSVGYVQRIAPAEAATIDALVQTRKLIIDTAALADLTINLPTDPFEGQPFSIFTTAEITALVIASETDIVNNVTTLAALSGVEFTYSAVNDKWYRTS